MPDGASLTAAEFEERIARLDGLLAQLEEASGPMAALGMEAVEALTEVYGTALARLMAHLAGSPERLEAAGADPLVAPLLLVHGITPQPLEQRVQAALEDVRPAIRSHGGEVELVGIEGPVVRVKLAGACKTCASSTTTLERLVTDAVLAAAPEIARIDAGTAVPPSTPPVAASGFKAIPLAPMGAQPAAR